jgi:UrcA family protein
LLLNRTNSPAANALTIIIRETDMTATIKSQSQPIISVIAASLIALSWAAYSGQARAADDIVVGVEKVSYGDLNLATEAGAKVLYQRLRRAADRVCTIDGSVLKDGWRLCYDKALNSAVASVNEPMVAALHNQGGRIGTVSPGQSRSAALASTPSSAQPPR